MPTSFAQNLHDTGLQLANQLQCQFNIRVQGPRNSGKLIDQSVDVGLVTHKHDPATFGWRGGSRRCHRKFQTPALRAAEPGVQGCIMRLTQRIEPGSLEQADGFARRRVEVDSSVLLQQRMPRRHRPAVQQLRSASDELGRGVIGHQARAANDRTSRCQFNSDASVLARDRMANDNHVRQRHSRGQGSIRAVAEPLATSLPS